MNPYQLPVLKLFPVSTCFSSHYLPRHNVSQLNSRRTAEKQLELFLQVQRWCSHSSHKVFGYFAERRGAGCSLRDAGYNLRGSGCEMVRTSNLSVRPLFCSRCHDSLTQKRLSHILLRYTSRTNPHSTPCTPHSTNHAPQPVNYTLQNR